MTTDALRKTVKILDDMAKINDLGLQSANVRRELLLAVAAIEVELAKNKQGHDWISSTLGHGETMCRRCHITNREAAVLGQLDCPEAELPEEKK